MTKITLKTIADRYCVPEADVYSIIACDTNDIEGMRHNIVCLFAVKLDLLADFLFDIIVYLKQCQSEVIEDE